jgi:hypothetical protein
LAPERNCDVLEFARWRLLTVDGRLCNQPSVFRRSWCAEHARRVFIASEAE